MKENLSSHFSIKRFQKLLVVAVFSSAITAANALTILSGPSFSLSSKAPLAGELKLTTDVDSRVSVTVTDGTNTWRKDFFDYASSHFLPILGFKPGRTNQLTVTAYDKDRNSETAAPMKVVTAPLPANFPHSTVLKREPDKMEPGYTLFIVASGFYNNTFVVIMNNTGEVVWYCPTPSVKDVDVRQLADGNLFLEEQPPTNDFIEVNMMGETVKTWYPPAGYPVDVHDGVLTDHSTILYITDTSRTVSNVPSSAIDSNAPVQTVKLFDTPAIEMSTSNSAVLHVWDPVDLLDPTRVSYLTFDVGNQTSYGLDNEHGNAVLEDATDDSVIISLREQNAVFKVSRSTGQLKWILGPHANWGTNWQQYLLSPVGTSFEWNYGQHAPELSPSHTLVLYDDGNHRASAYETPEVADQDNYSRAVEFNIDETNMEVSQIWDSSQATNEDRLFTPILGDADTLPDTGNILVTYGYVTYVNGVHPSAYAPRASMARIIEYTHDSIPEVVFDLSFFDHGNTSSSYAGDVVYRSDRIHDLYAHPAMEVTDLALKLRNGKPVLQFSADPTHTYAIQTSPDMVNWHDRGTATADDANGDFSFEGLPIAGFSDRYYRVITQ